MSETIGTSLFEGGFLSEAQRDILLSSAGKFLRQVRVKAPIGREVEQMFGDFLSVNFDSDGDPKLKRAVFNQRLASDLYEHMISSRKEIDGDHDRQIKIFVELLGHLSSHNDSLLGRFIKTILSGARAQAGLMFCLRNHGFFIVAPQNGREIRKMDLQGVDFAAVTPKGKIFFIDAKSDIQKSEVGFELQPKDYSTKSFFLNLVLERLRQEESRVRFPVTDGKSGLSCVFLDVVLPTGKNFMDPFGRLGAKSIREVIGKLEKVQTENWV